MKGPMINKNFDLGKTGIENVTPTILNCWGLASDESMDGNVIGECLDPGYLEKYPERREVFEEKRKKIDPGKRDDSEVEDLMKGLGYLN